MKAILGLIAFALSLNVFASSGSSVVKIMLEQTEVEKLEEALNSKGFTLSKIEDIYAKRGFFPRCPCSKFELTFTSGMEGSGSQKIKTYSVDTKGFGTSLQVTIVEKK